MRIALLTGDLSRKGAGVREVVEGLSVGLSGLGHTVEVFGLETSEWINGDELVWNGTQAHACLVRGPASLGYAPDMFARLRAFDPDVVHVHGIWQYPSRVALQWHAATGRPIFTSPHGMLHPMALAQARAKKWLVRRLYVDALINRSAALVGATSEEVEHIAAFRGRGSIVERPNGVVLPPDAGPLRAPAPWQGELSDEAPVMLFLGRFHHTKNLDALLDAWAFLHQAGQLHDWQLAIAGWGAAEAEAHVRTKAERIIAKGARIALTGPLFGADKHAALQNASGFILPSLNESFAISVLEAWGAKLPTLLSAACNMGFAVEGGAAFEVRTMPGDLAADIRTFLSLELAARRKMGLRGYDLVHQRFSWPVVAKLYEGLYEGGDGDVLSG